MNWQAKTKVMTKHGRDLRSTSNVLLANAYHLLQLHAEAET